VLRDALRAAATGDQALIERVYTEDVSGWSSVLDVTSRDDLAAGQQGLARRRRSPAMAPSLAGRR
jgi:hypothetical protein